MGKDSSIEWCDSTFNPWWGCTKVSPGCDHCYAERLATRFSLPIWGQDSPRRFFGDKHWDEPLKWDRAAKKAGVRHRVFCGSMCDVMEEGHGLRDARFWLWNWIAVTPNLDWMLLTKRPQNFKHFLPPDWLRTPVPNVWLLTSVETSDYLWRVESILEVPAVVHGVSYEPALGPVDFSAYLPDPAIRRSLDGRTLPSLSWVIAGGESGPDARPPQPEWFMAVRDQCEAAGVPFFFKQWGEWVRRTQFDSHMYRVGKKNAGRLLDGREHNDFPIPRGVSPVAVPQPAVGRKFKQKRKETSLEP